MNINKLKLCRTFALLLLTMAILMIPSFIIAVKNNNDTMIKSFIIPISLYSFIGGVIIRLTQSASRKINIRDCYMILFALIFGSCFLGAIPYYLGIENATMIESIFESTAGFTTTSATVFYEPSMSHSLILWKAIEHWIGGIGIIIFIISILPILGVGDQQLATVESHGTFSNKIAPRSKQIIKYVFYVYIGITLISFAYFLLHNMPIFDKVILALSTTSTSGILLHPEGVSHYNSFYVEFGVSILSILSGISFVLYIQLLKKNYTYIKSNIELRGFLIIILLSTLSIGGLLYINDYGSLLNSIKDSFFQVSSFATTSGFALSNYTLWNSPTILILLFLMLIGGCSASTTGSLKVIRFLIILKTISRGFMKRMHPRAISAIKIGNSPIRVKMVASVSIFALLYFLTIVFSTLILSLENLSIETTFGAAIGVLTNSGISFGDVGMSGDYSIFSPLLQLFLSFLMIVGRLEFITVAIVFLPSFWNPHKIKFH